MVVAFAEHTGDRFKRAINYSLGSSLQRILESVACSDESNTGSVTRSKGAARSVPVRV